MKRLILVLGCIALGVENTLTGTLASDKSEVLENIPTDCLNPCAGDEEHSCEGDDREEDSCEGDDREEAHFACFIEQMKKLEAGFAEIYKQKSGGEELFSQEEQDIMWHLRTDWVISAKMKGVLDFAVEEILVSRFKFGVDLHDFNEDETAKLQELRCKYKGLKEETYGTAYDFK